MKGITKTANSLDAIFNLQKTIGKLYSLSYQLPDKDPIKQRAVNLYNGVNTLVNIVKTKGISQQLSEKYKSNLQNQLSLIKIFVDSTDSISPQIKQSITSLVTEITSALYNYIPAGIGAPQSKTNVAPTNVAPAVSDTTGQTINDQGQTVQTDDPNKFMSIPGSTASSKDLREKLARNLQERSNRFKKIALDYVNSRKQSK